MPAILSIYFTRVFAWATAVMVAALSGLVSLFDLIELLRRAAVKPDATLSLVLGIAALRLPWMALQIVPFAVLLASIIAFWRLTRSSELIVARAAGVSAWQFLAFPALFATGLGVLATTVIGPAAAAMRAKADRLDDAYLRTQSAPVSLAGGQLWLRQSDHAIEPNGVAILHAQRVDLRGKFLTAQHVSLFRVSQSDELLQRIEAARARLDKRAWVLEDTRTILPGKLPKDIARQDLPTDLTVTRVQESFAPPDTLSVWQLPGFIALLERSGFSSIRHRLQFQSLLALPLLCGTMCLLGAAFAMRPARRGGVARMIGSGVAAGFALFVFSKITAEFGQSGALPPLLAAWAPAATGLLLSLALLLHLEDS